MRKMKGDKPKEAHNSDPVVSDDGHGHVVRRATDIPVVGGFNPVYHHTGYVPVPFDEETRTPLCPQCGEETDIAGELCLRCML